MLYENITFLFYFIEKNIYYYLLLINVLIYYWLIPMPQLWIHVQMQELST